MAGQAQAPGVAAVPRNINSLAAQGIQGAGMGAVAGMGYTPQQVGVAGNSASVNPMNVTGTNVTGSNVNPALNNVTGSNVAGSNIAAQQIGQQNASPQVMAQQLLNANINAYQNPYTSQVIDASQADLLRGANIGLDQLGAQAQRAGGFGGSRHGIAMSEMGRGVADIMAQQSAGLRQAGYQNAQEMAGQDIANNFQSQLANQQGGQFDVKTNMQRQLANQGAGLQASQANQQNALQAGLANQGNALQAQGMNQQYGMQGQLANQQNALQAQGMNQQNALQSNLANQNVGMQGQLANQQAGMQDINNLLQASLANQTAGLQGQQQRLGAAGQLGNISNLGFGMGQTVNQNLQSQGAMQQALQQAVMDAAAQKYGQYTGHPAQGLSYLNAALGVTPQGENTQVLSKQPGLFDYLTLGASGYTGGQ